MTDYSTMHWKTLQKECEARGIKFEGKDQAIAALTALGPVATTAEPTLPDAVVPDAQQADAVPVFNRAKPYGEVCGSIEEAPGARFFQCGHYFNNAGVKVG